MNSLAGKYHANLSKISTHKVLNGKCTSISAAFQKSRG
jgi:hypothetical protein